MVDDDEEEDHLGKNSDGDASENESELDEDGK